MADLVSFQSSTTVPLLHQLRLRNGVADFTLAEAATLTARTPNFLSVDPGGSTRVVTLPAEADAAGLFFVMSNTGGAGEDLTINNDAAGLIGTINPGEGALMCCDGTTWRFLILTSVEISTLSVDTISEATAGSGVTIDGLLLQDGGLGPMPDSAAAVFGAGSDLSITHNGTDSVVTNTTGNLELDNQAATGAVYVTLGTDTTATEFAVRNNSESRALIVTGDGAISMGNGTAAVTQTDGSTLERPGLGTGTGEVIEHVGAATEGYNVVVVEDTFSPAAIETALFTIPAGSIVDGVWAQVETALTGGGTTATWSIGITGDVDSFGTATSDDYTTAADSLAQDGKWTYLACATPLANAGASIGLFDAGTVALKLIAAATGGTAVGDTALTVGTVRIRVQYRTALPLANA